MGSYGLLRTCLFIQTLGGQFVSNYVHVPLFFALISENYGPISVRYDPTLRLRDRAIYLPEGTSQEEFIQKAHIAWLAQAMYRVRYNGLADDDLLVAFFGNVYSPEAHSLLREARNSIVPITRW
jgi:hypothetical protein